MSINLLFMGVHRMVHEYLNKTFIEYHFLLLKLFSISFIAHRLFTYFHKNFTKLTTFKLDMDRCVAVS